MVGCALSHVTLPEKKSNYVMRDLRQKQCAPITTKKLSPVDWRRFVSAANLKMRLNAGNY